MSDTSPIRRADELIAVLAERFPAFQIDENRRRPLRLGIGRDLQIALAGIMNDSQIAAALSTYTTSPGYLQACREGADRIDLAGRSVGTVTPDQAEHAKRKLAERLEQKINQVANGHDKEASRDSLADVRGVAAARKRGAS
jgi:ProP effector